MTFNLLNTVQTRSIGLPEQTANRDKNYTYTRNTRPYLHINYPEHLYASALAESGKYIYQTTVAKGENYVYFSHANKTGSELKYVIRIKNTGTSSVTVTKLKYAYGNTWDSHNVITNYFNSSFSESRMLSPGADWQIAVSSVGTNVNTPFTGNLLFDTTGIVTVTIYAHKATTASVNPTVQFPRGSAYSADQKVYTGRQNGYVVSRAVSLEITNKSFTHWFLTGDPSLCNPDKNLFENGIYTELIPLALPDGTTAIVNSPNPALRNLGNWAAHYQHQLNIRNTSGSSVTLYGYIGANVDTRAVLKSDNMIGIDLSTNDNNSTHKVWKFLERTIPSSNSVTTLDYTYVMPSHGPSAMAHYFTTNKIF